MGCPLPPFASCGCSRCCTSRGLAGQPMRLCGRSWAHRGSWPFVPPQACRHPNLVELKRVVTGSKLDSVFLVFEYCPHDLGRLVDTMPHPFQESEVKCLLRQVRLKRGQPGRGRGRVVGCKEGGGACAAFGAGQHVSARRQQRAGTMPAQGEQRLQAAAGAGAVTGLPPTTTAAAAAGRASFPP